MIFLSENMLLLGWLIPVLAFLFFYAHNKRVKALKFLASTEQFATLYSVSNHKHRFYKACLILLAFFSIVIALARPNWGEKTEEQVSQSGRDLIFMLDVSRSMLANDIKPNRLERAKIAIQDVVDNLHGDRIALVAFAGDNALLCPLTLDYGFFQIALENADQYSVGRGGTLIGDALRMVLADVIDKQETKYKDIILITDGEDHESFPIEAASEVGKRGIRLFTIGLGSDLEGERVPINTSQTKTEFLTYQGQEVWSKLDANTLRAMANVTPQGRYLNVGTGAVDLGEVYQAISSNVTKKEKTTITTAEEHFQFFVAIGLALLLLEILII